MARFEEGLIPFVHARMSEIDELVLSGKKLEKEQLEKLRAAIEAYSEQFK